MHDRSPAVRFPGCGVDFKPEPEVSRRGRGSAAARRPTGGGAAAMSRAGCPRRLNPAAWLLAFCVLAAGPAQAATHVVIVSGSAGEATYEQLFAGWVHRLAEYFKERADGVVTLAPGLDRASTRENILSALAEYQTLGSQDLFLLFLIGHGTFDQEKYRFNIPGPDITAEELSAAVAEIPARVVVVNGTSCSGAALPVLSSSNRVVITATRSGRETNPPRFVGFFIEGLDGRADADKNGSVSLLELFRFARQKTEEWYRSQNRLASEHALLDDSGGGRGTDNPEPGTADGALAASLVIVPAESTAAAANVPPELASRKRELEASIEQLRFRKSAMSEQAYQEQLEKLILELARVNREIAQGPTQPE
ncbi:MAG: hypothetical protein HYX74_08435 [Acidobacteria bacterium]|nr:hypothetical protein [Acidobacteriota bacterium]